MKLTIGNVVLKNNLVLAPMAGVTDLAISSSLQGTGMRVDVHGDGQRQSSFL